VFDQGYLDVEKDFPEQLSSLPKERIETTGHPKKKKITTKPF
jgi:hypothetical protein